MICATGNQSRVKSKAGNVLARRLAASKGATVRSEKLDSLGAGGFAKAIRNARTPLDWLSTDPAVVDAYIADELCGAMFSAGGYATLTSLTYEAASPACAAKIPADLPLLFIAGSEDPVGECGRGVRAAADLARNGGVSDVEVKLYEGMRHEILNEPGHAQVYDDVLSWMDARIAKGASAAKSATGASATAGTRAAKGASSAADTRAATGFPQSTRAPQNARASKRQA